MFSGCFNEEKKNNDNSSDKNNIIDVPANNGSTIYKKIGDEINITLGRSIACKWVLDDFNNSVLNLEQDFNWSDIDYSQPEPPLGDPGKRTWVFEAINAGETTLKFQSIFMGHEPYSIYGVYVLNIVVEKDESD